MTLIVLLKVVDIAFEVIILSRKIEKPIKFFSSLISLSGCTINFFHFLLLGSGSDLTENGYQHLETSFYSRPLQQGPNQYEQQHQYGYYPVNQGRAMH